MINLKMKKNPMPEQKLDERLNNFDEVAQGYNYKMAVNEAMRCLKCRTRPCTKGCPVMINIPEFVAEIAKGEFENAYQIISETSALPRVCGRVCPQEKQCEGNCVRGHLGEPVSIGRLERFVSDWHAEHATETADVCDYEDSERAEKGEGKKVAVVGSGPSGLTCAGDLALKGYDVTVFESLHKPGGILSYGIPEFCLPNSIVDDEVDKLVKRGVKFVNNAVIGKTKTVDELLGEGFEAVFIGNGASTPNFMNIPGENLKGVCTANEYLTRINLMKGYSDEYDTPIPKGKKIAIVGGGNVAIDAARCAARMGTEKVYIIYRRSMAEMPARAEEILHAKEEGIDFQILRNPVRVIGNKKGEVTGLECVKMQLGEPDESGRRRPVEIKDSNYVLNVDGVVMAIGTKVSDVITSTTKDLETNERGGIKTDEGAATSREGIFAGGDAVTGPATVILAMGAGKRAAASIDEYLK